MQEHKARMNRVNSDKCGYIGIVNVLVYSFHVLCAYYTHLGWIAVLTFNDNESGERHDNRCHRKHHEYDKGQCTRQHTDGHAERDERMPRQMLNDPVEHLVCTVSFQHHVQRLGIIAP